MEEAKHFIAGEWTLPAQLETIAVVDPSDGQPFAAIARGKLVDETALVRALADGTIAGAGLDVFANEPHVPAALLELERVVVQPHRASATHETRDEMGRIVLANLAACFAGQRPPTSVTR